MQKLLLLPILLIFTACSSSSSSSKTKQRVLSSNESLEPNLKSVTTSSSSAERLMDIYADVNRAFKVYLTREAYSFDYSEDIYDYADELSNQYSCQDGEVEVEVLEDRDFCGVVRVLGRDCYRDGKLLLDGEWLFKLKNSRAKGCIFEKQYTKLGAKSDIGSKRYRYLPDLTLKWSSRAKKRDGFILLVDGVVDINDSYHVLDSYRYETKDEKNFTINGGAIEYGATIMKFANFSGDVEITDESVSQESSFVFRDGDKKFYIFHSRQNSVALYNSEARRVSKKYPLRDIYQFVAPKSPDAESY